MSDMVRTRSGNDRERLPHTQPQQCQVENWVPGGQGFLSCLLAATTDKPRDHKSIAQWLQEWEDNWERATNENSKNGRSSRVLCN